MITKTQLKRLERVEALSNATAAAIEFRRLRDRESNPDGRFDNGGRFILTCRGACCAGIRRPSRSFPYSELVHGRSAVHVATLHGVNAADVRYLAGLIDHGIPASELPNSVASYHADAARAAIEAACA